MCVAFRIGFYGVFADSRLFAHVTCQLRLAFVCQLCPGVRGDAGGVMTSMRMQILSCVSLVDLVLVCSGAVHWREGGGMGWVMDVHANATSALWFSCCFVFCALVGRRGDRGISHRFLRCFPKISGQHCADPRLVAHASFDFHVYAFDLRAGVGKGGMGLG